MKLGKAFELFVKRILVNIGFSEVKSDGLYVFDGAPGQMLQGLGEAHNADVLLEPPVQTPFYSRTRLLIECKDYSRRRIGLDIVRSVLAVREDINHFDIVDINELIARRRQNRKGILYDFERFSYQVAIASLTGFTEPAQKFAATYRIPLIEFDRLPFWDEFCIMLGYKQPGYMGKKSLRDITFSARVTEDDIVHLADKIGQRMAVALTNSGQMLFLYCNHNNRIEFDEFYSLYWSSPDRPWILRSGGLEYCFQLPKTIMKQWLENAENELEMREEGINCKAKYFSNMIVYYVNHGRPIAKMISIDDYQLEDARNKLNQQKKKKGKR